MTVLEHFLKADLRVGIVVRAKAFPEARKPALQLFVDFGSELGILRSSAQITENYTPDVLIGKQVVGLVNIPERNIAGFSSQFLLLGAVNEAGKNAVLLRPDKPVDPGSRIA